ncbi:MAG: hypothetical protein CMI30_00580 [Opitutae bacterium]|nr:hypothetical protein [Rhodospirillaceae bacterium]MBL61880.1 hypothetical protein [Opitutae bacterium]|tara:strand:+ start:19219 stop:20769 length:1551 start_codon:yes stop_codon:yes gene_type:complete
MADDQSPAPRKWYQALGPGLITACVVIGPGSILTSSKVGAGEGYGMAWVVAVAVLFMMVYLTLGAKVGVVTKQSSCQIVAERFGRWLAVLIGVSVFFISASFQFGNNLGVYSAFTAYRNFTISFPDNSKGLSRIDYREDGKKIVIVRALGTGSEPWNMDGNKSFTSKAFILDPESKRPNPVYKEDNATNPYRLEIAESGMAQLIAPGKSDVLHGNWAGTGFWSWVPFDYVPVFINALALLFLFAFKNIYQLLEKLMSVFVGLMLLAFALNYFYALSMAESSGSSPPTEGGDIPVLALVGTTFVITAAFFQTYLVRQKGWKRDDLPNVLLDARVGAGLMAMITLLIMANAAESLRGMQLTNVEGVARQLRVLFGDQGQALFCVGLFCAAFSSFLINSMIGGFILADGLGLGQHPEDKWTKRLTAVVLLTGMVVALFVIKTGQSPVTAIVMAQAVTILAAPLLAAIMLWITNQSKVMGEDKNTPAMNLLAGLGFVMLLAMAYYTATAKVWPKVKVWLG